LEPPSTPNARWVQFYRPSWLGVPARELPKTNPSTRLQVGPDADPHTCDQEPPHSKVLLVCHGADVPFDREDVSQYKLFRSRTAPRAKVVLRLDILLNLLSLRRGMDVSRISPAAAAAPLGPPEPPPSLGTAVPRTPCYGRSRALQPPESRGRQGGQHPRRNCKYYMQPPVTAKGPLGRRGYTL
jgi:hypothetical protein